MRISPQIHTKSPERIFQHSNSRKVQAGQIKAPSEAPAPKERVTLAGREGTFTPLRSLSGEILIEQATKSALDVASGANLPSMVTGRFTPAEFCMLNSGDYHDAQHPIKVANATETLAKNAGVSSERAEFLRDVSLLHDADERILMDGQGGYNYGEGGVKARVPVTLAFMDLNQTALQERFEWDGQQFKEAKALIAGTEHPLNDNVSEARFNGLAEYDGLSAAGLLKRELQALPKEKQAQVTEELQIMRFADQSAEYFNGVESAASSVKGLAVEIDQEYEGVKAFTPTFLSGLGQDNEAFKDLPLQTTKKLVSDLGIAEQTRIFSPEELHGFMSDAQAKSLADVKANIADFKG